VSNQQDHPRRRWHDNRGELSEAFELLDSIPKEALPLIADAIIARAEKEFRASDLLRSLSSLGSEKVLALYKSKNRMRSYDKDPDLHRIVNNFFVLPDENQMELASQFLGFTDMVIDYLAVCDSFGLEPKEKELESLQRRFVDEGLTSARQYLAEIHGKYHEEIGEPETTGEEMTVSAPTNLVVDDTGMKIRNEN
jgi:hypothetical protein